MSEQDPLPESHWGFRRVYTWALTAISLAMLGFMVWRMPADMLQLVALWLIGLIGLIVTYYLLAPSAGELARLVAELRTRFSINDNGEPR